MKPFHLALFALLTATVTYASSLQTVKTRGELILGTDPQYAPFESRDEKGDIVGFDVDVAAFIARQLGVTLKTQPTVLELLPVTLQSGRVDIAVSGLVVKPEWRGVAFSDPYFDNSQVYAVRAGNPARFALGNLRGRTVGVRANTIGFLAADEQLRPKGAKLKVYSNFAEGLRELRGGNVDAMVLDAPSLEYLIARQPKTYERLTGNALTTERYVIGVRRGSDLLPAINRAIKQLRSSAEYTRLLERWIVEK
jgi:polar amino acid transport system substrate-binding protein